MQEPCKTVTLNVDATEVKQVTKKVQRLVKLLREANLLANELNLKNLKITIHM